MAKEKTVMREFLMPVVYITHSCNMDCAYCYVKKENKTMSWKTAKQAVDFLASLKYKSRVMALYGGEPLLEWDLVKRMIEYAETTSKFRDFYVCTNATLIDREKLEYFSEHKITPMMSLDGFGGINDANRKFCDGSSAFERIDAVLGLIGSEYADKIRMQIRVTLNQHNIASVGETIDYILKKNLFKAQINFMPDVHSEWDDRAKETLMGEFVKLAEKSFNYLKKGIKLNLQLNECIVGGADFFEVARHMDRDSSLRGWKPFCHLADQMLSIDLGGGVYPCYIAAGLSPEKKKHLKLGDVFRGIKYPSRLEDLDMSDASNPCCSCLAWNFDVNNKLMQPADAYKILFDAWVNAARYFKMKCENI